MTTTMHAVDPRTEGLLRAVREAEAELRRASPSTPLGDERHAVVGLFDGDGAPLAVSHPAWLASMADTVRAVRAALGAALDDGAIALTNDPFAGGTHVNDVTVVRAGSTGGLVAARIHTADVGGERLGGTVPTATEVWQEGVRLPPLRFQRNGRADRDVATLLAFNSRIADVLRADLAVALTTLDALDGVLRDHPVDALLADAAIGVREALAGLDDGTWSTGGRIRHCCTAVDEPFRLRLEVRDGRLRFAFDDEPGAVEGFVNCPVSVTRSALMAPLTSALPARLANAALLEAVTVETTPGSLFHARPPAATGYAPFLGAAELARCAATLLGDAGWSSGTFAPWFAMPPRPFSTPSCEDPACPFRACDDAHATRYVSEARS